MVRNLSRLHASDIIIDIIFGTLKNTIMCIFRFGLVN